MEKELPGKLDRETLKQLPPEQLVGMIIEQAIATEKLNKRILELEQELEKLRVSRDLDSKISSKPPSSDLLKKSEKKKEDKQQQTENKRRKPGGQPGHTGKTRKGFGRVDRYELSRAEHCGYCGQRFQEGKSEKIETRACSAISS